MKMIEDWVETSPEAAAEIRRLKAWLKAQGDLVKMLEAEIERLRAELASVGTTPRQNGGFARGSPV
jgi:hypothetical protein